VRRLAIAVTILSAVAAGGLVSAQEQPGRAIDAGHSHAAFTVSHLYLSRVTGRVPIVSGTVVLASGSAIPLRVSAVLDPKRIDSHNGDRDDDLQGPDWFDTKRFPAWSFVSDAVHPGDGTTFTIDGELTVHGVTQPVTLTVTTVRSLPDPVYHAVGHVDRHGFGMQVTPQDGLVGSDVELVLDVTLR